MRWAAAQQPPPDEDALFALLSTVRYNLVPRAFFETTVLTEGRLQGGLGLRVLFGATAGFTTAAYGGGPVLGKRRGTGHARKLLTWGTESTDKGSSIQVSQEGKVATAKDTACQSLRSATPLPTSGRHLVEVLFEGMPMGRDVAVWIGLLAADAPGIESREGALFGNSCALALQSSGFWGVDSDGAGSDLHGIRRGAGGKVGVLAAAKTARIPDSEPRVFIAGDRIGLQMDMDAHTLTILRNGTPIPTLFFDNLPSGKEMYIAATLFWQGNSAQFVN